MGRRIGAALVGLPVLIAGVGVEPVAAQEAASTPASTADTLPPLPQSGFGVPAPTAPISTPAAGNPPQAPSLRLPTPGYGVTPLQAADPNAPAFLIRPQLTVSEAVTYN